MAPFKVQLVDKSTTLPCPPSTMMPILQITPEKSKIKIKYFYWIINNMKCKSWLNVGCFYYWSEATKFDILLCVETRYDVSNMSRSPQTHWRQCLIFSRHQTPDSLTDRSQWVMNNGYFRLSLKMTSMIRDGNLWEKKCDSMIVCSDASMFTTTRQGQTNPLCTAKTSSSNGSLIK